MSRRNKRDDFSVLDDSNSMDTYAGSKEHALTKIIARLQQQEIDEDESYGEQPLVVLVATGSFSPVHREHVDIFQLAKSYLESHHECKVMGGLISPSHDMYVRQKLGHAYIPAVERLHMIDLAVADSDWLAADPWECALPRFVSFEVVADNVRRTLEQSCVIREATKRRIRVFFLCGADLVLRCRLYHGMGHLGVVAVGRPEFAITKLHNVLLQGTPLENVKENVFILVPDETDGASSTLVRRRLQEHGDIAELVHPSVAAYLREHPEWWTNEY